MTEESFLMVSLDEEKSKKLAQVLSNDTARKILDILSKQDMMTETQVAKELTIPLSTAHYNLSLLIKSDLINDNHFTYSEKGKKIIHYQLSNKYVIIAPKKSSKIFEKLKDFFPVVIITSLVSVLIKYFWNPISKISMYSARSGSELLEAQMVEVASDSMQKSASPVVASIASSQDFALWFLIGSLFALIISFIWTTWIKKK